MKLVFSAIILVVAVGVVHASGGYNYPDEDEYFYNYDEEKYNCPDHETYSECGTACERTCETLGAMIKCTAQCVEGCFCQKGYVRIKKGGKCIPESKCPKPKCEKPHEVWSECGKTVCEATCDDPKKPYHCKAPCFPGCGCKEGYLRDLKGNCVLPKQCPPKCKKNEIFKECGTLEKCEPTCDKPIPGACPKVCRSGCFCKDGFIRDKNRNCIPKTKCPKPTCSKPHQEYSECGANGCQATCANPDLPKVCRPICTPGCVCKPGYILNDNKDCIPKDKCPSHKCKGEHEVYNECGPHEGCLVTCDKPTGGVVCPLSCNPGCFCKEGYVRNNKGVCVPKDKCPKPQCGPHEVWSDCGGIVCPPTCEVPFIACKAACIPGCGCKEGYLRNTETGECIPKDKCPKCKGKHEAFMECAPCIQSCNNQDRVCVAACLNPGCYCKSGYLKDVKGVCIPRDQCPKPEPKCKGKFEEYVECGPCATSCENPDIVCAKCNPPACYCKSGYLRNDKGLCIPKEECPKKTCNGEHEIWTDCDFFCGNKYCHFLIHPVACKPSGCTSGCICKEGYYRAENGRCIPKIQCPPAEPKEIHCKDPLEEYKECGPSEDCELTCAHPLGGFACPKNCRKGCFCKEGYVRDKKGKCILKKDCPKKECKKNEHWADCSGFCWEKRCKDLLHPIACMPGPCEPGCVCNEGFYRNDQGHCVASTECPEAKECPKHEVFSPCDKRCDRLCRHITRPILDCFMMGCHPGCICGDGYYRDDKGVCILRDTCPEAQQLPTVVN